MAKETNVQLEDQQITEEAAQEGEAPKRRRVRTRKRVVPEDMNKLTQELTQGSPDPLPAPSITLNEADAVSLNQSDSAEGEKSPSEDGEVSTDARTTRRRRVKRQSSVANGSNAVNTNNNGSNAASSKAEQVQQAKNG
ncbi:MAG: hypothetical protein IJ125_05980, partial [Atopobiaceae bacterium]|nr:hypothetical protein [Atopobiaceae bacterium]